MQYDKQEDVLRRLRGVEGHVRDIARMIEYGDDCPAILRQITALHGALDKVSRIMMGVHLTSTIQDVLQGDDRVGLERALDEVSNLLLETHHG